MKAERLVGPKGEVSRRPIEGALPLEGRPLETPAGRVGGVRGTVEPFEPGGQGGKLGGGGVGLAALGAAQIALSQLMAERDAKIARQGRQLQPLTDERGNLVLEKRGSMLDLFDWFSDFGKRYTTGPLKGQGMPIDKGDSGPP